MTLDHVPATRSDTRPPVEALSEAVRLLGQVIALIDRPAIPRTSVVILGECHARNALVYLQEAAGLEIGGDAVRDGT